MGVQGSADTMLGVLLCGIFLRPSYALVLRWWEDLLLHAVGWPGVPSLLDGVQRRLLHTGPRYLRDVQQVVLHLHRGAVSSIAGHRMRLLWCQVLPCHLRRRGGSPPRVKTQRSHVAHLQ